MIIRIKPVLIKTTTCDTRSQTNIEHTKHGTVKTTVTKKVAK
jgi:hypothetical protein